MLAAERRIETALAQPGRSQQIAERGRHETLLPEELHGFVQDLLLVELLRPGHDRYPCNGMLWEGV
ncbi:hypothetical protein APA386B_2P9 (plasmid) [Acetobacter pasteurianus 386B]|nr:hypothetical protein APA386B_2P9 [Acetobacter pasteurianus 386B]